MASTLKDKFALRILLELEEQMFRIRDDEGVTLNEWTGLRMAIDNINEMKARISG